MGRADSTIQVPLPCTATAWGRLPSDHRAGVIQERPPGSRTYW